MECFVCRDKSAEESFFARHEPRERDERKWSDNVIQLWWPRNECLDRWVWTIAVIRLNNRTKNENNTTQKIPKINKLLPIYLIFEFENCLFWLEFKEYLLIRNVVILTFDMILDILNFDNIYFDLLSVIENEIWIFAISIFGIS